MTDVQPCAIEVWSISHHDDLLVTAASGPEYSPSLLPTDRPDAVAGSLAATRLTTVSLCHSTSWRWTQSSIMLTYLAVGPSGQDIPWVAAETYLAGPPVTPTAPPRSVLAHALRHLRFLLDHDDRAGLLSASYTGLLDGFTPTLAGELREWEDAYGSDRA